MIVSTSFLKEVSLLIDTEYFTIPYVQKVVEWVLEYYHNFETAPFMDIKPVFDQKSIRLPEKEVLLIEQLLTNISTQYTENPDLNLDYLVKQTISYFQKRELEITAGNVKYYLEQDEIAQAELELLKFKKVMVTTSSCVNVFDEEVIKKAFKESEEGILHIPGYLGEFIGPLQRGWLIALQGGYKKGKTWWLLDFIINAVMDNLNVAFFSLEMSQNQIIKRIAHRVTGLASSEKPQLIPILDCLQNQKDFCHLPERPDQGAVLVDGELVPFEHADAMYKVCTFCRDMPNSPFIPTSWYERVEAKPLTTQKMVQVANAFKEAYGNSFKLQVYPRFSANIIDIKHDLDLLESTENFVPDLIVIDYADILKPESNNTAGTQKEDETWIALAQLAGERNALTITPTQITKEGQDAKIIEVKHTARWSGKLGHVDAIYGINQTQEEKDRGQQRLNTIMHRHEDFNPLSQCLVLQNFNIGAVHLDSCRYVDPNNTEGEN